MEKNYDQGVAPATRAVLARYEKYRSAISVDMQPRVRGGTWLASARAWARRWRRRWQARHACMPTEDKLTVDEMRRKASFGFAEP